MSEEFYKRNLAVPFLHSVIIHIFGNFKVDFKNLINLSITISSKQICGRAANCLRLCYVDARTGALFYKFGKHCRQ